MTKRTVPPPRVLKAGRPTCVHVEVIVGNRGVCRKCGRTKLYAEDYSASEQTGFSFAGSTYWDDIALRGDVGVKTW